MNGREPSSTSDGARPVTPDARYRGLIESAQPIVWSVNARTLEVTSVSDEMAALLGFPAEQWTRPGFWQERIHPADLARTGEWLVAAAGGGPEREHDYRALAADGRSVWLRSVVRLVRRPGADPELLGVTFDQTSRRRADALLAGDLEILQQIAAGRPLGEILEKLALVVEDQADGMIASILLLEDGLRVRHAAGPHLPPAFAKAVDGEAIGPDRGSCGTAAHRGEPVIVEDIATDPLWERYREPALAAGLRACWSIPIHAHDRSVLGTFALYYSKPRRPSPELLDLARHASHLAAVAIERDRRVDALVERGAFARAVVDHALDANVIMDASGIVTGWNLRAAEIFGWTAAEAVGRRLADLIIPERFRTLHTQGLARFRETGTGPVLNRRMEIFALHRSGREFPVELAVSPIRQEGRVIFSAFIADITARKKSEEALRASDEHLSLVYRHVEDVLFQIQVEASGEYRFVSVNPAFCRSTGLAAEQVVGKSVREVIPEPSLSIVLRKYEEAIRTNRTVRWEEVTPYPTGVRYGDVAITPVVGKDGRAQFLIGSVRDFTDRRRLEEDIRQLQKMEAVGRLTGGVAHDFNNLLTVILGYGEILLGQLPQDAPARSDLQEMIKAGGRAADLTRQLMAFARKQTLQPRRLDLNGVVAGMEKMLRRLIPENIELRLVLAPDLPAVRADPGQIEQVVLNLAINARDAIPAAGRITFETAPAAIDAETARRRPDIQPGPCTRLSISDTGCGMDAETRSRIFEPFFTTKAMGKGTGLGLATVYGIVRQSRGHLEVESEPGRGTTFRIYLPLAGRDDPEAAAPSESLVPRSGGEKILVVEDQGALRLLCERMFETLGYPVTVLGKGEEALAASEEGGVRPDLLVTDLVLPGMGGRELADRLRRSNPRLKVLYMSGYSDKTSDGDVLGAPFLQKPFTLAALAAAVRQALDQPLTPRAY